METYRDDVHYHSIHHVYHVVLSSHKLLDILLTPGSGGGTTAPPPADECAPETTNYGGAHFTPTTTTVVHKNRTFGIRSNPLLQLAFIYSALIHDAGHQGISNAQLVLEGDDLAMMTNNNHPSVGATCETVTEGSHPPNNNGPPEVDKPKEQCNYSSPPSSCDSTTTSEECEQPVVPDEEMEVEESRLLPTHTVRIRDKMRLSAISALSMDAKAMLSDHDNDNDDDDEHNF